MVNAGDIIRASDIAVKACRVTRTTNQSIPDATETLVTFNAETYDTDGMHSTVTNNSRITIVTAGVYEVGFNGRFPSGNDYSVLQALLRVNGTTYIAQEQNPGTGIAVPQRIGVKTTTQFVVGDYIEVLVYQDNTGNTSEALEVFADYTPVFYATRLGS